MKYILKAGNSILTTQGFIFQVGDMRPPVADYDAALITDVANQGPVMQWKEQSGNNNTARQTVAAEQPVYIASAVNGKPAVQFNGMQGLNMGVLTDAKTILVVCKANSPSSPQFHTLFGGPGASNYYQGGETTEYFYSSNPAQYGGENHNRLFRNGAFINPKALVIRQNTFVLLSLDVAQDTLSNRLGIIGNQGFLYPNRGFNGQIARLLIFDYRLTELDRKQVENQLMTHYALI